MVAEVDEVLVRHGHQTFVQDGQAAHARVEHANRPRIHTAIVSPGYAVHLVRRFFVLLAVALTALVPTGRAAAGDFTQTETKVTMSDGVQIAVSYFEPKGTPPAAGWPAVVLLHGLGQTRNTSDFVNWSPNLIAQRFLAPEGYAVLTYDARAHGESGGQFTLDGPRELQDLRELLTWLTTKHPVDAQHVGAYGASYGGGLVWRAAVEGLPLAAIVPAATWTDLLEAIAPQGHVRAGIVLGFSQDIPRDRYGPEELQLVTNAMSETNMPAVRAYLATRSTRSQLGAVRIPTFMLQGRRDFAFDADQAIAAFRLLKGCISVISAMRPRRILRTSSTTPRLKSEPGSIAFSRASRTGSTSARRSKSRPIHGVTPSRSRACPKRVT